MKTTVNRAFRYIFVFLFIIVLFAAFASYFYYKSDNAVGPNLITAFVGVVLSALVTLVLLNGQTKDEEYKEKNVRVFQRKQRCYSEFINKLWACKSKDDFEKVEESMRELIFVVNKDKLEELTEYLKTAKRDCETFDKASESYAKITKLLRDDLYADSIGAKEIKAIFDACHYEPESEEEEKNTGSQECIDEEGWNNQQFQTIWQQYENGKLQCWHFNALDVEKQAEALNEGKMLLSLIEYDEDWRTERLKQVKEGDIVFLFNRGGDGYVGMYRALGTIIVSWKEQEDYQLLDSQNEENPIISLSEAHKYDIYNALNDGATSIASIHVEPVFIPQGKTFNPIGTMRQTIVRPNYDNVYTLLKYFEELSEKEKE